MPRKKRKSNAPKDIVAFIVYPIAVVIFYLGLTKLITGVEYLYDLPDWFKFTLGIVTVLSIVIGSIAIRNAKDE